MKRRVFSGECKHFLFGISTVLADLVLSSISQCTSQLPEDSKSCRYMIPIESYDRIGPRYSMGIGFAEGLALSSSGASS